MGVRGGAVGLSGFGLDSVLLLLRLGVVYLVLS